MKALALLLLIALTPAQQTLRADVATLADDAMQGRETGTAGYARAADHVAARFRAIGLSPVPGLGWRQRVPLLSVRAAGPGRASATLGGQAVPLGPADIALSLPVRVEDERVTGVVVAAGHCTVDAAAKIDDFARMDVRGRIVACQIGASPALAPLDRAIHGAPEAQASAAHARGALGIVVVQSPAQAERTVFSRYARAWRAPRMVLSDAPDEGRVLALLSAETAARLFASDAPVTLTLDATAERHAIAGDNVVGLLPGSDPARRDYLVVSAHLDHLGATVSPEVGSTDRIANGALDNAIGVAAMIAVAEQLVRSPPQRGILFVAFTGEEQGLLGSRWFVAHPPIARRKPVGAINLDMPILTYAMTDVTLIGGARSALGPLAAKAAAGAGLGFVPDPDPDGPALLRSDQYSFIAAGIPAVLPQPGPGNGGSAAARAFLAERYHRAGDDMTQPIDWAAADRFVAFVSALALLAAR